MMNPSAPAQARLLRKAMREIDETGGITADTRETLAFAGYSAADIERSINELRSNA